jgi:hypothetical protein
MIMNNWNISYSKFGILWSLRIFVTFIATGAMLIFKWSFDCCFKVEYLY